MSEPICECGHPAEQHVQTKNGLVCASVDRLGYSNCRCDQYVSIESSDSSK